MRTTLELLLRNGCSGYFFYDPAGINKERRQISRNTGACLQAEKKPEGWLTGVAHYNSTKRIFVNLRGSLNDGPLLDEIEVV
jgi:hypothetical protein